MGQREFRFPTTVSKRKPESEQDQKLQARSGRSQDRDNRGVRRFGTRTFSGPVIRSRIRPVLSEGRVRTRLPTSTGNVATTLVGGITETPCEPLFRNTIHGQANEQRKRRISAKE